LHLLLYKVIQFVYNTFSVLVAIVPFADAIAFKNLLLQLFYSRRS